MIDLNLGVGYTLYTESPKSFETDGISIAWEETYDKNNLFVALGLNFKLGGKSE